MSKRVFITGASGCVGHYLTETLLLNTDYELFLLVRDRQKLTIDVKRRPGVQVIEADMADIDRFHDLLQTIDIAVLTAAAWGGAEATQQVNVQQVLKLLSSLDPERCQQVIYFSTESVLGHDNELLPEAALYGTDYIRTKYQGLQEIENLAIAPKVTAVFPTLVFGGGSDGKRSSFLTAGLQDVVKWLWLIRFFKGEASFHIVHAYDIAQVVRYLIAHPPAELGMRKLVLGSPAITLDDAVRQACDYFGWRIWFQIPLTRSLVDFFVKVFRIQMTDWDRFCLNYRHFTHTNPVSPAQFGMVPYVNSLADLFRVSGFKPRQRLSVK